jgi:hypothetical protein
MTHKLVIAFLTDCIPLETSLGNKFLKFYERCVNSKSSVLKGITQMSLFNPFSINASNHVDIINSYYTITGLTWIAVYLKWNNNVKKEDNGNVVVLTDRIVSCIIVVTMGVSLVTGIPKCSYFFSCGEKTNS